MDQRGTHPPPQNSLRARAGLLLASFPIVASVVQAVAAAGESNVVYWKVPVLPAVAEFLKTAHPVLLKMAILFENRWTGDPLAPLLFLLILVSLGLLASSLFRPFDVIKRHRRDVAIAGAIMSTVVFLVPTAVTYGGLLFGENTASPVGLLIAAIVLVLPFVGVWQAFKYQTLTKAEKEEREIEDFLQNFEGTVERGVADVDQDLERLSRSRANDLDIDVTEIRDGIEEYGEYQEKKERYESRIDAPNEARRAERLRSFRRELAPLDADTVVTTLRNRVRQKLADELRRTYGDVAVRSERYDRPYDLGNDPEYRTVELPDHEFTGLPASVPVDDIETVAVDIERGEISLGGAVATLDAVGRHVRDVRRELRDEEAKFTDVVEAVGTELAAADERIDEFPGELGERLAHVYRQGVLSDVMSIGAISSDYRPENGSGGETGHLNRAVDLHHECRFERALTAAEEADEMVRKLRFALDFLEQIVDRSNDGVQSMKTHETLTDANPFFSRSLVEREVGTRLDGVQLDCSWDDGRIHFEYRDGGDTETTEEAASENTRSQSDYSVSESVRWVLNSIRGQQLGEVDNGKLTVNREEFRPEYDEPEVFEAVVDYLERQNRLGGELVRDDRPDEFEFEFDVADDRQLSAREIGEELLAGHSRGQRRR